ncbi:MAG: branched-chain-amino-acid transaminase [Nitriliruptoraceae bacterium]
MTTQPATDTLPPFGTVPAPVMVVAHCKDGGWGPAEPQPVDELRIHPFAHALHYGSAGFEGLKAHRGVDGVVRLFRHRRNVERLRRTAQLLHLPPPPADLVDAMVTEAVAGNLEVIPSAPGALYLRPLLLGTEPNIGAAASPSRDAMLVVLASPVGDYFSGGGRALTLLVETERPRTTPQFGEAKAAANYALALGPTLEARGRHAADQVLFAPDGQVQETGAANFLLFDEDRVVTRALDGSFLHGVTRDSVLTLAADLGFTIEERAIEVEELRGWRGEAALSGTAAVLAGVGRLIIDGETVTLSQGRVGPVTTRLRDALVAIQRGEAADRHGWTVRVER